MEVLDEPIPSTPITIQIRDLAAGDELDNDVEVLTEQIRSVRLVRQQPKRQQQTATPGSHVRPRSLRRMDQSTEKGRMPEKSTPTQFTPSRLCCIDQLREELTCSICLEICLRPCTTPCGHTFCKSCLRRSLHHNKKCPKCRELLAPNLALKINTTLWNAIQLLFPHAAALAPASTPLSQTLPTSGSTSTGGSYRRSGASGGPVAHLLDAPPQQFRPPRFLFNSSRRGDDTAEPSVLDRLLTSLTGGTPHADDSRSEGPSQGSNLNGPRMAPYMLSQPPAPPTSRLSLYRGPGRHPAGQAPLRPAGAQSGSGPRRPSRPLAPAPVSAPPGLVSPAPEDDEELARILEDLDLLNALDDDLEISAGSPGPDWDRIRGAPPAQGHRAASTPSMASPDVVNLDSPEETTPQDRVLPSRLLPVSPTMEELSPEERGTVFRAMAQFTDLEVYTPTSPALFGSMDDLRVLVGEVEAPDNWLREVEGWAIGGQEQPQLRRSGPVAGPHRRGSRGEGDALSENDEDGIQELLVGSLFPDHDDGVDDSLLVNSSHVVADREVIGSGSGPGLLPSVQTMLSPALPARDLEILLRLRGSQAQGGGQSISDQLPHGTIDDPILLSSDSSDEDPGQPHAQPLRQRGSRHPASNITSMCAEGRGGVAPVGPSPTSPTGQSVGDDDHDVVEVPMSRRSRRRFVVPYAQGQQGRSRGGQTSNYSRATSAGRGVSPQQDAPLYQGPTQVAHGSVWEGDEVVAVERPGASLEPLAGARNAGRLQPGRLRLQRLRPNTGGQSHRPVTSHDGDLPTTNPVVEGGGLNTANLDAASTEITLQRVRPGGSAGQQQTSSVRNSRSYVSGLRRSRHQP